MDSTGVVSALLTKSQLVFWDFDGVIKDSVDVKTTAYVELFRAADPEIAARIRQHHEAHGGVSRFEKIPLYLEWAGKEITTESIQAHCDHFSQHVIQAVIDAPWVPGVRDYLLKHYMDQYFILATATPQEEIEFILQTLDLAHCFRECHGAPAAKSKTIRDALERLHCSPANALFVGDAETDFNAARENKVPFLLRRTSLNLPLQALHKGPAFDNLDES